MFQHGEHPVPVPVPVRVTFKHKGKTSLVHLHVAVLYTIIYGNRLIFFSNPFLSANVTNVVRLGSTSPSTQPSPAFPLSINIVHNARVWNSIIYSLIIHF